MIGDFKIDKNKIKKLKEELLKLNSVDKITAEVVRLANEVRKVDIQSKLSPKNRSRVKQLETRYNEVLKTINKMQGQFDKEIASVIGFFQKSKSEAKGHFETVKKKATTHKQKFSKTIKAKLKKTKKSSK